ncbi:MULTISPECIES: Mov34/MPN/PAD-1 family protein [unclassified Sphingomonas]|uniref:Mov34/MPN/PAD-1 family protein n=1 Tax=unclassified Sphingomonas TaxID=196159 RepID=UPI0016208716|nr:MULTISPECIES: M67 family metallopeptidase [unclassified Sphingomonas]MBB3346097.1 proteasome lid subunit RPN8/RPN11 [Sphingomonas sp. BK069]MBB3475551.1 proteasome lid subunit RPN8/RPN11 [Sphingomonas sp. BK345]
MVDISIRLRDELIAAAAGSADEVCGLLLGRGEHVERALPCRNVAATPATRFELDPAALLAAHRAARAGAPAVLGHYHSHPSGDASPSPRDAADAIPDGSLWLIVAGEAVTAWRAVEDGALHGRFVPVAMRDDGCGAGHEPPQGGDAPRAE